MPRAVDRMFWEAREPLAVEGSALTVTERRVAESRFARGTNPSSAVAYKSDGSAVAHSLLTDSRYAFVSIGPAAIDFGTLPEEQRKSASRKNRSTVSTFEDEIRRYRERGDSLKRVEGDSSAVNALIPLAMVDECPPDPSLECNAGSPRPMGVSIPSGMSYGDCYRPGQFDTTTDRDQDGVHDVCESELAIAFRPQMKFDAFDCETRRQPHFAVRQRDHPDFGPVIYIFYAISYLHDCGPLGHNGDSEWIILEVGPSVDPSHGPWSLKYGTLSAHWKAPNDNTAGYEARDLEDAENSPGFGAPRIWASKGKHANYRTRVVCNTSGFWNTDSCDAPSPYYFTLVFEAGQNLGRREAQFIGSFDNRIPDYTNFSSNTEILWEEGIVFCGWLGPIPDRSCSDSYFASLRAYGF